MKAFKLACLGLLALAPTAVFAEQIPVARTIIVESCTADLTDCKAESPEPPVRLAIPLSEAGIAKGGGLHGEARFQTMRADTPFKGEIYINRNKSGSSIYAVLRSGRGTKRPGVTKHIKIDDSMKFKPKELVDKPIMVEGKTYRAKMRVTSATIGLEPDSATSH